MTEVSGIVLCGGKSSRFGRSKECAPWAGSDILHTIVEQIGRICDDVMLVANEPMTLNAVSRVRRIQDIYPRLGPLGGIHAGLVHARNEYSFVIACDMPFFTAEAAHYIIAQTSGWDAVLPGDEAHMEPLFACYHKSCLPFMEMLLQRNVRRVLNLLPYIRYKTIDREEFRGIDRTLRMFTNINTADDYENAKKLLMQ